MEGRLKTFTVRLSNRFHVRVHVWETTEDSPNGDGTEAAYFVATALPRKIGDIHFGRKWLDTETIAHEAYHAIAELRRRVVGAETFTGEEWCAQQQEKLIKGITDNLR